MLKLVEFYTGTEAFSLAFEKTKKVKTIFSNDYKKIQKRYLIKILKQK